MPFGLYAKTTEYACNVERVMQSTYSQLSQKLTSIQICVKQLGKIHFNVKGSIIQAAPPSII